jgi:tetratricopeptide (TPR) repeat protein
MMQFAEDHALPADADRERATLLATGDVGDYGSVPFRESLGDAAEGKQKYALAGQYWEQALTTIIRLQLTFADSSANSAIPARLHRLAAQGYFADHKIDAGLAEARLSWNDDPADVDCFIAVIRAADAAGASSRVDDLYHAAIATYSKKCADNPGCADMHNGLAWTEARSHRDLDDALVHAQRAVAISPDNAAILDTLAEVYYQRHDFQKAVDWSNRSVQLFPPLRDRLARFQLALKTGKADDE